MEKTPEELKKEAEDKAIADALAAKEIEDRKLIPEKKDDEEEETVESLKAKLAKEIEDKENYKKGLLALKAKKEKGDNDEEEIDVKNIAEETATNVATKAIEKSNEKTAISQFINKYPALKDSLAWTKIIENYNPKNGKDSVEAIKTDLEAALILARHYGGGKVAEKEVTLNNFATTSHAGSTRSHDDSKELDESTLQMGKMFGNSEADLKKTLDPNANEISLI